MSRRYVIPLLIKFWLSAGLLLLLLFGIPRTTRVQEGRWYFLTGTSTEDTDRHYPSTLYTIETTKKLKIIRHVTPRDDGIHSIRQYDSAIFVNYPHLPPTTVSVVHIDNPALADPVIFNPEGQVVVDSKLAVSEPNEHSVNEIVWLLSESENRSGGTVVSIAGTPSTKKPRIERDASKEYSFLRFSGIPGGPVVQADLVGSTDGATLGVKVSNRYMIVDSLPTAIGRKVRGGTPYYLGIDEKYLVFALQHSADDLESGALGKRENETIYVHNKNTDKWDTMTVDGSCSRTRMLGSWLATIVAFWDPHHKPNPGTEHERSVETDDRPNVRELYTSSAGRDCFIPGELRLLDLESRQKIAWHTGEEDSEILSVRDNRVVYRVNDTIYQARMAGNQIQDPVVLVKDDDVPEVHWAFWAP